MRSLVQLFCFILIAGCARNQDAADKQKSRVALKVEIATPHAGAYPIKVVCTTGMVADLVRTIGGAHLNVDQLMGQDVDPHLYRVNTSDISRLNDADVIFYNGLHLEGKMGETLERMASKIPTIALGEYLEPAKVLGGFDEKDLPDPHIWFDVSLWHDAAGIVRDVLVKYDPSHAADYRARADVYRKELTALHEEVKGQMATIPKEQRVLITSHDAFRYLGRAYAIEVHGVQGVSTESEASLKDIEDLVKLIVDRKVKAVFVETSVNARNVEALIAGCGAQGHTVNVGGQLFSDAMGAPGTAQGTYAGMVRHNTQTIVRALK